MLSSRKILLSLGGNLAGPWGPPHAMLGRALRELDDRRGLLEHAAAMIEHEVVVGGDLCEGYRETCRILG